MRSAQQISLVLRQGYVRQKSAIGDEAFQLQLNAVTVEKRDGVNQKVGVPPFANHVVRKEPGGAAIAFRIGVITGAADLGNGFPTVLAWLTSFHRAKQYVGCR